MAIRIWEKENRFQDRRTRKALAAILRLHHQGKGKSGWNAPELENEKWPGGQEWIRCQDVFERRLWEWLEPPVFSLKQATQADAACMLMLANVILADWIASGSFFFDTNEDTPEQEIRERACDFLRQSGMVPMAFPRVHSFCTLWPQIPEAQKRPLQNALDCFFAETETEELPQMMILEAPMGEGKTEAGIYAAFRLMEYWKKNGFYIALPTSATANQMEIRMNRFLKMHGERNAKLLHSSAWLFESEFQLEEDDVHTEAELWLSSSKRGLLAPAAVGTVDQAMMAAMRVKYGVLRLEGLAGKALIIDEAHAYDAYMSDIIGKLLEWCKAMSVPVVMLSATLPPGRKRGMISCYAREFISEKGYPMMTAVYQDGRVRQIRVPGSYQKNTVRVEMLPLLERPVQVAEQALKKIEDGGCVCVLMNTIKEAQQVYQCIREMAEPQVRLLLFHSGFSMGRRAQIEKQCVEWFGPSGNRPQKAILVATQVVEQSIDIDMDALITAVAPIDLLLQRVGRMHRRRETWRPDNLKIPVLTILMPESREDYGATELIYYRLLLERTVAVLEKKHTLSIPDDIPELVEMVYDEECREDDDVENFLKRSFQIELQTGEGMQMELGSPQTKRFGLAGEMQTLPWSDEDEQFLNAKTRLGEVTRKIAVVPQKLFQNVKAVLDAGRYPDLKLSRQVLLYSVTISERQCRALHLEDSSMMLQGSGRLHAVWVFCCDSEENVSACDTLMAQIGDVRLSLDRELGLFIKKEW